jgi:prepilin-type N-terminal cleavage/methylation domain-containing protein
VETKNISTRIFQCTPLKQKGFSLIELSVVISIAAAATVGYLAWTQPANITDAKKAIITNQNMDTIAKAIEAFRVEKGRIPCPADPYILPDNTHNDTAAATALYGDITRMSSTAAGVDLYVNDYGTEDLDTSDTDNDTVRSVNQSTTTGKVTLGFDCPANVGAVPAHSLGLENKYMLDGWGRRLTYQVSKNLCGSDAGTTPGAGLSADASRLKGCTKNDYINGVSDITVSDGTNVITKNAAYVLLSHGANGNGAFLPSGSRLINGTPSSNEIINNTNYSTGGASYVKAPISSTFDDLILFKTKTQLERLTNREAVKQISVEECEENSQAIKNITLNEGIAMSDTITSHLHGTTYNNGQQVSMGILMGMQTLCVKYYGAEAATINNKTWSGAQCPGNNNPATNGSTYDATSNSCTCDTNNWDGNCIYVNPFDPNTITGLTLWLDANDASTLFTSNDCATGGSPANLATIGCWKNKKTSGTHFTQSTAGYRPAYRTSSVINSKPGIAFSGGNALTGSALSNYLTSTLYTIFAVFNTVTTGNLSPLYNNPSIFNSASYFGIILYNNAVYNYNFTSAITYVNKPISLNTSYLVTLNHNSSTLGIRISSNGSMSTTATAATTASGGISQVVNIGSSFNGTLSELLVFNVSLENTNSAARDSIESFLINKWGL